MKRIRTLEQLDKAVRECRAVVVNRPFHKWRTPAAFLISMQARLVLNYLRVGVYLYPKKHK